MLYEANLFELESQPYHRPGTPQSVSYEETVKLCLDQNPVMDLSLSGTPIMFDGLNTAK